MLHRMRGLLVREGAVLTGDLTEPRLGPERSRQEYPIAGVLGAEARVSFESGRPVTDAAPLAALGADLTHPSGHEIADVPVLTTWRRGERTTP